jgi:hypothetical protein
MPSIIQHEGIEWSRAPARPLLPVAPDGLQALTLYLPAHSSIRSCSREIGTS